MRSLSILVGIMLFIIPQEKKRVMLSNEQLITTAAGEMEGAAMPATFLALGDSYTIGESVAEGDRFPVQAVKMLNEQGFNFSVPEIIAKTGWTTHDLLNAINNKPLHNPFTVVSLLIGVNNQYQGGSLEVYKQEFKQLLEKAIVLANHQPQHVFVLSIPDYSVTPFASHLNQAAIAAEIDRFNEENHIISEAYKVHYINITDASRMARVQPHLLASDGLHYAGAAYFTWASLLVQEIKKTLP
jgi:lysophospholipase L1-like esterase